MHNKFDFDNEPEFISSSLKSSESLEFLQFFDSLSESVDRSVLRELAKRNHLEKAELPYLAGYLSASTNFSKSLYRKSEKGDEVIGQIWANIIHRNAELIENTKIVNSFSQSYLNEDSLDELKKLSLEPEKLGSVSEFLLNIGIILIFEPTLKGSLIDGVVGKTSSGRPYIGLSLRHKRLDNFWFTLFHELGHIHYHFELLDEPILDSDEFSIESDIEFEADIFAKQNLIPRRLWNRSPLKFGKHDSKDEVYSLAQRAGIHPAIVAGRIMREKHNYSLHSEIVNQHDTRELLWKES